MIYNIFAKNIIQKQLTININDKTYLNFSKMVDLISKQSRNDIGIDSAERAIIYSLLHLRDAYLKSDDDSLKDSFKIVIESENNQGNILGKLRATGELYFDNHLLTNGANILDSIIEKAFSQSDYIGRNLIPSEEIITPIQDDIEIVDSLEKYLYWNCQLVLKNDNSKINKINILPRITGNVSENRINIFAQLNFNLTHYLETNNLIESIGIINNTDTEPLEPISEISSFSGNDLFAGNDVFLGN